MTLRLRGLRVKTAVFFTTPLSRNTQERFEHKEHQTKYTKMTRKPRSNVRILIYCTGAIVLYADHLIARHLLGPVYMEVGDQR